MYMWSAFYLCPGMIFPYDIWTYICMMNSQPIDGERARAWLEHAHRSLWYIPGIGTSIRQPLIQMMKKNGFQPLFIISNRVEDS